MQGLTLKAKLLSAAGIVGAIVVILGGAERLWEWQPFALAGDVTEEIERLERGQVDTAIETYSQREDDLILKGGAIDQQPLNSFNIEQKQIITRELRDTRNKLDALQTRQIELSK